MTPKRPHTLSPAGVIASWPSAVARSRAATEPGSVNAMTVHAHPTTRTARADRDSTGGQAASDTPHRDAGDRDLAIETRALTKRYGEAILAVDRLDLRVRRGEVYGFLGPNGAGKTTTLRMLLGLVRPTSGEAVALGAPPGAPQALARIGAMVESPAFYPYLTGRDNLRVLARHAGIAEDRVDAVLEEMRLHRRADDRAATPRRCSRTPSC
jgi:ABC-type glutathione transport system ATPase component